MKAANWIDRAKAVKGWGSDYKAAKELGMTRSGMSSIRTGDSATLSEETAIKVAGVLGVNPAAVILDQVAERSKEPEISTIFHKMAKDLLYIMSSKKSYGICSSLCSPHAA